MVAILPTFENVPKNRRWELLSKYLVNGQAACILLANSDYSIELKRGIYIAA